jgi:hypothetical protein
MPSVERKPRKTSNLATEKNMFIRTVSMIAMAVVLFLSLTPFSSASRFQDPAPQEKEKKKEPGKEQEKKKEEEAKPKISGELGSKENPVRCNMPRGERAYLNRLRCADGKAPAYHRIGSFGLGPYGNIIDGYNVKCEDKDPVTVFMDMYHEHVEKEPVPGFTIVNDETKG